MKITREGWAKFSPEDKRIHIAGLCGWIQIHKSAFHGILVGILTGLTRRTLLPIPDYLNDLNAMHEAEKLLRSEAQVDSWYVNMKRVVVVEDSNLNTPTTQAMHATAEQRAEAFVLTMEAE